MGGNRIFLLKEHGALAEIILALDGTLFDHCWESWIAAARCRKLMAAEIIDKRKMTTATDATERRLNDETPHTTLSLERVLSMIGYVVARIYYIVLLLFYFCQYVQYVLLRFCVGR